MKKSGLMSGKKSPKVKKEEKKPKAEKKVKKEKAHVPTPRVDADGNLTLNANEAALLMFLKKHKSGATLKDAAKIFARKAGKSDDYDKAHSWTRNAMRKPERAGLVEKIARGTYALTKLGRKAL